MRSPSGCRLGDLVDDFPDLRLGERPEIRLGDLQGRELDEAIGHGDLGVDFGFDRPECGLVTLVWQCTTPPRTGSIPLLILPARNLWLVQRERTAARGSCGAAARCHRPVLAPQAEGLVWQPEWPWVSAPPFPAWTWTA